MGPKVSVIIPIYKVEKYLPRCIESILSQTYHNLEVILVDDGSPDHCPYICDEYAQKDDRILVIHKPNGGLSHARNAGLKAVTGDYIYFFDGDDYVANTLIETALINALTTSADLVIFNYFRVDEQDNLLSTSNFKTGIYEIGEQNRINYIVNTLSKYVTGWEAWNRLYKADIIRDNNLVFWDNKLIFAEDFGFSLNYAFHANKISCIPDVLYYYLIRNNSIMSQAAKEPRLSASLALSKLVEEKLRTMFPDSVLFKQYPVLFYSIMYEQLRGFTYDNYKESLQRISDKEYFHQQLNRVLRNFSSMIQYHGLLRGVVALLHCFFLLTGRLERLSVHILELYRKSWKIAEVFTNNKSKMHSKKRIFLIGCEDFSNLGELHAAIAENEFLKDTYPGYEIIEITASEYQVVRKLLPFIIHRRDLLFLPGGGMMEHSNSVMESIRREIIKKYKENRKVIFPLTIHSPSSEAEKLQFEKEHNIVNKSKNLTVCVRENHSYELAKQIFFCNVIIAPEIGLYSLDSNDLHSERKGAILLLQNDGEGVLSDEEKATMKRILHASVEKDFQTSKEKDPQDSMEQNLQHSIERIPQQSVEAIRYNDIVLISDISIFDRKDVVQAFIDKITKAEIVITDRLHGLIFCATTQTPCILLPNYKSGVEALYEGFLELDYLILLKDMKDLEDAVQTLLRRVERNYDNSKIVAGFDDLAKYLNSMTI